jgi:hypothetical protein
VDESDGLGTDEEVRPLAKADDDAGALAVPVAETPAGSAAGGGFDTADGKPPPEADGSATAGFLADGVTAVPALDAVVDGWAAGTVCPEPTDPPVAVGLPAVDVNSRPPFDPVAAVIPGAAANLSTSPTALAVAVRFEAAGVNSRSEPVITGFPPVGAKPATEVDAFDVDVLLAPVLNPRVAFWSPYAPAEKPGLCFGANAPPRADVDTGCRKEVPNCDGGARDNPPAEVRPVSL